MKRILYCLIMLAMITPALACGGMMPAKKAQAAQDMPCHGALPNDDDKIHGVMLFKDCLKVELAKIDSGDIFKKPNFEIVKVIYDTGDLTSGYNFEPLSSYHIRGPPIETAFIESYPDIYLTTQRLRI